MLKGYFQEYNKPVEDDPSIVRNGNNTKGVNQETIGELFLIKFYLLLESLRIFTIIFGMLNVPPHKKNTF
jgi:hypothetical protein